MHHTADRSPWEQDHNFDEGNPLGERNTKVVVFLTASMMVGEIAGGLLFNSMALLADGWHMGTHVAALGITVAAYWYARRHAADRRFAFGTWKVGMLGGYTSAIVLGLVALYMATESARRLLAPLPIQYEQALAIAAVGLAVNLVSALLLKGHHGHAHDHGHHHGHGHEDLNLRAAYLHVLADALTSVLALVALAGGRFYGWDWLDPVMGIVGAMVVSVWAWGLLRDTSRALLDREMDPELVREIRACIETDSDTIITDLHVWRVGRGKYACILTLVATAPRSPDHYRALLQAHEELGHVTVEVHQCLGESPAQR
ncbi:MAG: CDF family Co(II)/Ni(II) efflux transporter DmeF [Planctomycetes bacterium]|nr:CDF family Co(II)/Ni(II) efflux transporter DmeF [Planctomycetota bacterium]